MITNEQGSIGSKSQAVAKAIKLLKGQADYSLYELARTELNQFSSEFVAQNSQIDYSDSRRRSSTEDLAKGKIVDSFLGYVDFPNLFRDVANTVLKEKWQNKNSTWRKWVNLGELKDFREANLVSSGIMPEPRLVKEGAEYKQHNLFGEIARAKLETYGDMTNLSRATLLSDDKNAYSTIIKSIIDAYDRKIGSDVYKILTENPIAFEGKRLFDAAHNNIVSKTSDFAADLGSALEKMYGQTFIFSEEHEELIGVQPKFVICSPGLSPEASAIVGDYNKAISKEQQLSVIVEPRLKSTDGWFLATDKESSSISFFRLEGSEGPTVMTKDLHHVDGMDIKYQWDTGVSPVDYRGLVRVQ